MSARRRNDIAWCPGGSPKIERGNREGQNRDSFGIGLIVIIGPTTSMPTSTTTRVLGSVKPLPETSGMKLHK